MSGGSITVSSGEVTGLFNDFRNAIDNIRAGSESGGDYVSLLNLAAAALQAIRDNPATGGLAATSAAAQLAGELSRLQDALSSGDRENAIDAGLGAISAVGGVIAVLPSPHTKAVGIAIAAAATATKELYKSRQDISDFLNGIRESLGDSDAPFIWMDPQRAIDAGLIDPKTLLPRPGGNTQWTQARAPLPRDPLAIDLDGDGIETLGIPANGSPVLFDHDADGVRTGTGWLRPDDGWLVRDLNGNGSIDTGRELFGVDTRITVTQTVNGQLQTTTRNAANGFEALSALDTGNGTVGSAGYGDMVFNAQDAEFANLQVWRDLNGDGISQAGELQTLSQAGIASISLNANTSTTNLGNGNSLTGVATVTHSNGSTTQIDSVSMQAGNLNLANNPFYRDFPNAVPVTAAAQALPEMGGSGILRDLRESMSLGTTAAARLTTAVQAFAAATTRTAQKAALDELLLAWATTNPTATQWVLGAGPRTRGGQRRCRLTKEARALPRQSVNMAPPMSDGRLRHVHCLAAA